MTRRFFHVDHALLGDGSSLADAAVVVEEDGTIAEVGRAAEIAPPPGAKVVRVHGVLFPGLVNAHTHLELSALRGKVTGGRGFLAWVDALLASRAEAMPEDDTGAIEAAVAELVRAATMAVGDVTNTLAAVGPLARAGLVGFVFHEIFGQDRAAVMRRVEELGAAVARRHPSWPTVELRHAPAAHTLYTTHPDAVRALLEAGTRDPSSRTTLHLAEHAGERRAVEHGDGPVVEWFERRTGQKVAWPKRPLFDHAEAVGALRPGVLLVHLSCARRDELSRVRASGAGVVVCPRSNLYIEASLPPLLAMLGEGLEPALGTDSLASNTSLDVLAEARALWERFPSVAPGRLVAMATGNGARALGLERLGRIRRGARPGLFAVRGEIEGDPAAFLLTNLNAPRTRLA
jgi:aminodeoxyfutalosine deaminase